MKSFLIRFDDDGGAQLIDECYRLFKKRVYYYRRKDSRSNAVIRAIKYAIKQKTRNHHKIKISELPGVPISKPTSKSDITTSRKR